nr:hypothetical protein [Tanacetum cinerariifolium]
HEYLYLNCLLALWGLELRVFRGVGYGMVRDCRELVEELARKQERETNTNRKTKRKATKISQSSGPTILVADETVYEKRGDRVEMAATIVASLDAWQESGSGPRCQDTILRDRPAQTRFERLSKQSHKPHLSRVNTLGSGEDSLGENDQEDASNQGRNNQDEGISFVQDAKIQGRYGHDNKINTASTSITTDSINITTVEPVTAVKEKVKAEVDNDQQEVEMKMYMKILSDDEVEIDAIPLSTKPPIIVDWKIIKEGKISS